MINITKNITEITFNYINENNYYNSDKVLINNEVIPITYKKNYNDFFYILVNGIDFMISNNYVKGTDKSSGTFNGELNKTLYYTVPIKTDFVCDHG